MRRWNLLYVAAALAAVLITLSGPAPAMADAPDLNNFKGKAAVYSPGAPTDSYFVVSFTCSNPILSGKWTLGSNVASDSGTIDTRQPAPACFLTGSETTGFNLEMTGIKLLCGTPPAPCGTLDLTLSNIRATKTYVPTLDTEFPCPASDSCIEIHAALLNGTEFHSTTPFIPSSYGTLTIQLPKNHP